ncbi:glycoside hydrolase family 97 catalytic domain-containing protein [Pseudoduganella danionis]|nr:glycoside hydrolase family 97 protein [Pseudoduganella danionis]
MVKTGFSVLMLAACSFTQSAVAACADGANSTSSTNRTIRADSTGNIGSAARNVAVLRSPDRHISVTLQAGSGGTLRYSIARDGRPVLLPSQLGLQLQGADLSQQLSVCGISRALAVHERYSMAVGKRRQISYRALEQTTTVSNPAGQRMEISFRVSNDGVAFRYRVREASLARKQLLAEQTSFALPAATRAWLQPMSVAQTGWNGTNPSYEEHYQMDIAAGSAAPTQAGWVFPALFRAGANWLAISEAGMDGSYQASRLAPRSDGAEYRIGQPMAAEVYTGGGLLADVAGTLTTPWRVLALGSLKTVTDSTLGTDLAAPAIPFPPALVQPGHASWSWALLKDDATVYEVQKKFIDYAADMHWDYTLIDADWDRKIGYDKVRELVQYAATKQVGILLWYNSSGAWNTTEYTPKSQLLTHAQRVAEFERLRAIGVKGVKIDFFGGDGQSMIAYYTDILRDAAAAGLLVNFHGATLPRGWSRTYPNLMTMEAVRGLEFTTFEQVDEDRMPAHAAMLPFTRNLFDPMDFTPMVFGSIPNIRRSASNGFELATSVLYLSGIQHFAETPEGMAGVPAYVKQLLQELPRSWDDSRLLDGYPGQYVVMARRAGQHWYIAGINAGASARTVTLDLSFAQHQQGSIISDGAAERSFEQRPLKAGKRIELTIQPRGGFLIQL